MAKPKGKSNCLLSDKEKARKYLTGIKLSSLQPYMTNEDFYEDKQSEKPETAIPKDPVVYAVSNSMMCSLCDCKFETRQHQKDHYKLDWHRFNLKQRMAGQNSVTEDSFAQLADDVSSISGSGNSSSSDDDDGDDDMSPVSPPRVNHQSSSGRKLNLPKQCDSDDTDGDQQRGGGMAGGRRYLRIYFENDEGQVVSLHRCVIHSKKDAPTKHSDLVARTLDLLSGVKWALMMTGGGHFAAAVYNGSEVVVHKTFHRYTVRAKRGTAQALRDAQGNAPKSAGASLRRHNEAALNQDVQDLLTSWKPHLDVCQRIFMRLPTYNRAMFFGGKHPVLDKSDPRIVTIPFATRRATYRELQRVWSLLATVECHGTKADVEQKIQEHKKKEEKWRKAKTSPGEQTGVDNNEELDFVTTKENNRDRNTAGLLEAFADKLLMTDNLTKGREENIEKREGIPEEEGGENEEIEFNMEEITSSTSHLKEFDTTHKRPKRKKKKKQQGQTTQEDSVETSLTNELYTVCRTGDLAQLSQLLNHIQQNFSTPSFCDSTENAITETSADVVPETNASSEEGITATIPPTVGDGRTAAQGVNESCHVDAATTSSTSTSSVCTGLPSTESTSNEETSTMGFKDNTNTQLTAAVNEEQCPSVVNAHKDDVRQSGDLNRVTQDATDQTDVEQQLKSSDDPRNARPGKKYYKFLNKPLDNMGYTFLHVAAEDGQKSVLYRLMECGADPGVKNKKGKPPYACSLDKKTRDEFRQFRVNYPDRYDYERAQIPAPLTEEQEKEKAAKQAERKRVARKAKRTREKEQKEEQEKQEKEEEKQQWFASLSEREKRALAAEKRFAQQVSSSTDIQRCWKCGQSLSGEVPFSYLDFRFCSMPCLKQHKQNKAS